MKNLNLTEQKGIASIIVLGIMALMAVALPVTTKLVQRNQENRSKAAEENVFSCDTLRDIHKNYFDVCAEFDNVCFNKKTGEYQGCGSLSESNGGDCTDANHNTNAETNILCSINSNVSLSCDTLHDKRPKYFATCSDDGFSGVCFDKQTGEFMGCVKDGNNDCTDPNKNSKSATHVLCNISTDDSASWTNAAGKCGSAYGKTFEATPTTNLCESGDFSRAWFSPSDHRYYWRCGNVEKYGNEAANCFAVVNGVFGSSKIILDRENVSLGVGQSIKINAKLDPPSSSETITWSSNMPDFFSVDSNGVIKMLKGSGAGRVTAMTSSGQAGIIDVDTSIYTDKVDAKCGSANGQTFTTRPENGLCENESSSYGQLIGNKFSWTCTGSNGGSTAKCEATIDSSPLVTPTPLPITKQGAFLFLKSDKTTYSVGETFTVTVGVNSDGNIVGGVDGVINYDSSVLTLVSAKKSVSMVFKNSGDNCIIKTDILGKVSFTCFSSDSSKSTAVNGELVLLRFLAKKSGKSKVYFECNEGSSYDSNIVGAIGSTDIINCSKNVNFSFEIQNSSVARTPTPSPYLVTLTPTSNPIDGIITIGAVDAKCGSKRNTCDKGDVSDGAIADTEMDYKWRCFGLEGGKDVNCSLKKSISRSCLDTKTILSCSGGVCVKKTCASGKACVDGGCITKPASGKKPSVGQACGSFGICIKTSGKTKTGDKCISTVNGGIGKIRINLCSGNNSIRCCEIK